MADDRRSKRTRTSSPGGDVLPHVAGLPDSVLADVAAYLPKPSQALFAVAMMAAPSSTSSASFFLERRLPSSSSSSTGRAILSPSQWDTLDFSDIDDDDLASKLSDADVGAVLVAIDAVRKLERLKLAGCVKIDGSGLEPLRGSNVIRKIDLSLVGEHRSPDIKPGPFIREENVVPILDSIIDAHQCSLSHLQLPSIWRENRKAELSRLIVKYNRHMESRELHCSQCEERNFTYESINDHECYGLHSYTCYNCINHLCDDCNDINDCVICSRGYCSGCKEATGCNRCELLFCNECASVEHCEDCLEDYCQVCEPKVDCSCSDRVLCCGCDPRINQCDRCDVAHCDACLETDNVILDHCDACNESLCSDCRFAECSKDEWKSSCSGCLQLIAKKIIPKLAKENERLRREIEDIRDENSKLRSRKT